MVTASGTVHTASKTVNADLFFGIRGGGCNFGIVTEFVYQLHPQRAKVFAGLLFYPLTEMKFLVSATRKWYESIGEKEGCVQAFTIGPDGTVCLHFILIGFFSIVSYHQPVIVITLFYNGSEEEGKAKFKAFYDIRMYFSPVRSRCIFDLNNPLAQPTFPYRTVRTPLSLANAHTMK